MKQKYGSVTLIGLTALIMLLACTLAEAVAFPDLYLGSCGIVEDVTGSAFVMRGDRRQRLTEGFQLRVSDTVTTEKMGSAKLRLADNTEVHLGSDSMAHIVELVFKPEQARLQVHIDKGEARILTGAIGLKDPKGIRVMTPKNLYVMSNCVLSLIERYEEEIAEVEWMPVGPTIALYNPKSERIVTIGEAGMVLITNRDGEVFVSPERRTPKPPTKEEVALLREMNQN